MNIPPVTVLLPVRNGERWIADSVRSLATQTYSSIEILLVDDGSTDRTVAIARDCAGSKLRVVQGDGRGVASALSLGVREASSEIVLRLDADDVAEPDRVRRQVEYLQSHPDCVLLGSDATLISAANQVVGEISHPRDHDAISLRMCVMTAFVHPSVAFRRSAVLEAGNYRGINNGAFAEDFDLWSRLESVGRLANLPEKLVRYRLSPGSITKVHWPALARSAGAIATSNLTRRLGLPAAPQEMQGLLTMFHLRGRRITLAEMLQLEAWLVRARMRFGPHRLQDGFTWDVYARPLSWLIRSPRAVTH